MSEKARFGRPPVDTQGLTLRLPTEMIARLDDLRRREPDLPNRQEMIRRILEAHLKEALGT